MARYQALTHTHIFAPVSVEISGACGSEALIAGGISSSTKDPSTLSHLLQQVSVAIQSAMQPHSWAHVPLVLVKVIFCKFKFILFLVQSYCYCINFIIRNFLFVCFIIHLLVC